MASRWTRIGPDVGPAWDHLAKPLLSLRGALHLKSVLLGSSSG